MGAESLTYRTAVPQVSLLTNHIRALRTVPGLESSYTVVVVESNLGNEAMHHQMYLTNSGLRKIVIMNEDTGEKPGFRATNATKRTMAILLNEMLNQKKMYFYENMVCINGKYTANQIKKKILDQVANYKRVVEPPKHTHQAPKERYTGKSGGSPDDLAIALQQCLIAKAVFYSKPEKYGTYHDI